MAMDEVVTLPVRGENGARSIELPEGWIESALVQARRVGTQVVLEPVPPESQQPAPASEDVHASWPPGFWEWLDEARAQGDFGDFDPAEIEFRHLHFQEVDLDDQDESV